MAAIPNPKGRPRVYEGERLSATIRFPKGMYETLRTLAKQHDVSINFLVLLAVEHYLDEDTPELPT